MRQKPTTSKLSMFLAKVVIFIRYYRVHYKYRYYLRYKLISTIHQWKYFIKDYIIKKPYKIIAYDREFGPELLATLPFAYWHYRNGTLKKTISAKGTSAFYYFSPEHEESYTERHFDDPIIDIPNSENHVFKYNLKKWQQVPLKSEYENDEFRFDKPTVIISNKYNQEWDGPPVNYLDIATLEMLFESLSLKYQVIYNRPPSKLITGDNSMINSLGDYLLIENKFPKVLMLHKIHERHDHLTFNELQLKVYSNCEHFISVQGGNSVLCSYFGGTNVVLAKKGMEIFFKEYENIYPLMAGTELIRVQSYEELLRTVKEKY